MENTLIPKKVFYIWFGHQPKPFWFNIVYDNWVQYFHGYEIVEVNEDSPYFDFKSVYNNSKFFKLFYDMGLYAMAADYARCKILYDYGGIYLDTDITFKKDITPLLSNKFFIGEAEDFNDVKDIAVGIFGCVKNYSFLQKVLEFYDNEYFNTEIYSVCEVFREVLDKYGPFDDFVIYPKDYFYPYSFKARNFMFIYPQETYAVHWWNASWNSEFPHKLMRDKKFLLSRHKKLYILRINALSFINKQKRELMKHLRRIKEILLRKS